MKYTTDQGKATKLKQQREHRARSRVTQPVRTVHSRKGFAQTLPPGYCCQSEPELLIEAKNEILQGVALIGSTVQN